MDDVGHVSGVTDQKRNWGKREEVLGYKKKDAQYLKSSLPLDPLKLIQTYIARIHSKQVGNAQRK